MHKLPDMQHMKGIVLTLDGISEHVAHVPWIKGLFWKYAAWVNLNKCLKQIKLPISNLYVSSHLM